MFGRARRLVWTAPAVAALAVPCVVHPQEPAPPGFSFTNVAREAGLNHVTVFGGESSNKYLLETTGTGVAFIDIDNDGWLDLFFVNGTTLEGFPAVKAPTNHLYRNKGDGVFEDVTARAGLAASGWGQGACVGDYDGDGYDDLFVTYFGQNRLYHNRGNGAFEDVTRAAGLLTTRTRWGTGCAFLDYDRDGRLDLFVANYIDLDLATRNNHDGTFTDIGVASGCAYSQDGKPQAGMGVGIGDYDRNGTMDVFKTNFAGDTATLYSNSGDGFCQDRTFAAGIGINTRWLGWGTGFVDLDNDGWLDLFLTNGHVYPEVAQLKTEAAYKQRKVVYRNLGNGRFADVTERLGPPAATPKAGRGTAFGDFDNDGQIDVAIANVNDRPDLFRLKGNPANHWVTVKLAGVRSNRDAIGARVHAAVGSAQQFQEVRGGGSYLSQNDFRVHFGLGSAARLDRLDVRWPNGLEESWEHLDVDRFHTLKEGSGRVQGPGR